MRLELLDRVPHTALPASKTLRNLRRGGNDSYLSSLKLGYSGATVRFVCLTASRAKAEFTSPSGAQSAGSLAPDLQSSRPEHSQLLRCGPDPTAMQRRGSLERPVCDCAVEPLKPLKPRPIG